MGRFAVSNLVFGEASLPVARGGWGDSVSSVRLTFRCGFLEHYWHRQTETPDWPSSGGCCLGIARASGSLVEYRANLLLAKLFTNESLYMSFLKDVLPSLKALGEGLRHLLS